MYAEVRAAQELRKPLAILSATATFPRVNNPVDPTRGHLFTGEAAWSSSLIGSSQFQQFTRFAIEGRWYRTILPEVVLAWRARAGRVFGRSSDNQGVVNFVPVEQRFYAGGPNDVRGFPYNQLGPIVYVIPDVDTAGYQTNPAVLDDNTVPFATGGNVQLIGNVEVRFPAPIWRGRLRLAAFVDMGGVWQTNDPVNNEKRLVATPGMGLRLLTPVGPLRFDVAYSWDKLQRGTVYVSNSETEDLTELRPVPGGRRSPSSRSTPAGGSSTSPWGSRSSAHVVRVLVLLVVGVIASLVGVIVALTVTPPGRALLARNVSHQLETLLRGQVLVGGIEGSFLRDLVLTNVVVRDTSGVLLVSLPVVRVRYLIPNFLAKRFILETLEVDNPIINLVRHASGRWNYEEVLRLSEGPPGKKSPPPLIEFRNMKLKDGTLALAYPWPTGNLRPAQRDSQLAAVRAIPGRMVEDTPEGTKRVMAFSNLTTAIRRLRISTPDRQPLLVVLDTLSADASEPQLQIRQLQGTIQQQGDTLQFCACTRGAAGHPGYGRGHGELAAGHDHVGLPGQREPKVDLVDLRFISPEFPAMTGRANIVAQSLSGRHTNYALTEPGAHRRTGTDRGAPGGRSGRGGRARRERAQAAAHGAQPRQGAALYRLAALHRAHLRAGGGRWRPE